MINIINWGIPTPLLAHLMLECVLVVLNEGGERIHASSRERGSVVCCCCSTGDNKTLDNNYVADGTRNHTTNAHENPPSMDGIGVICGERKPHVMYRV